jgi:hypothetical protein
MVCRTVLEQVMIDGRSEQATARVCSQQDGTWKIEPTRGLLE